MLLQKTACHINTDSATNTKRSYVWVIMIELKDSSKSHLPSRVLLITNQVELL